MLMMLVLSPLSYRVVSFHVHPTQSCMRAHPIDYMHVMVSRLECSHACNGVQVGVLSKELWAKLLALAKPSAGQKGAAVHLGLAEWELAKPLEGGLEIAESPALDEGIQLNREDRTALADEALNEYAQFFFTADDN